ncbi:hypothetical protein vseg_017160 [Gypsophila vaccaria]
MGIINPCYHYNYPPNYLESNDKIIVEIHYHHVNRLVYHQIEQQTISYIPISAFVGTSNPVNPLCPHCMADVIHELRSTNSNSVPRDDIIQDTTDRVLNALRHRVHYMAHQLKISRGDHVKRSSNNNSNSNSNNNVATLISGVCVTRYHDIHCCDPIELEAYLAATTTSVEARPTPAAEAAVDGLERVDDVAGDGDCVVCLEELVSRKVGLVKMPCQHVFHEDCIVEWLRNSHVCPLCRFELPVDDC